MAGSYVLLAAVALCGLTSVLCEVGYEWEAPKYCNGLECPRFTVIKTTNDYELRKYEPSKWVMTSMEGVDYSIAVTIMFRRLFNYITGNNELKKKVDMTAPVLIRINKCAAGDESCRYKYSIGFYIAPVEAASPPTPSDPEVKIASLPQQTVYAKHFGGFAGEDEYNEAAKQLEKALGKDAKVNKSFYYAAGYDSPLKPFDRRNEVWFIVE